MDFSTFRTAEMTGIIANTLAAYDAEREATRPLIDISRLEVPENLVPHIQNVNSFLKSGDFSQASSAADAAINEMPDSAVGWFAKIAALTRNFTPANFDSEDSHVDLSHREFVALKKNTINMATPGNSAYISARLTEYEGICRNYLEACACSRIALIYQKISDPKFKSYGDTVGALTRENLALGFSNNSSYEYSAKQYPNSLILCCEYVLLYLNAVNNDRQNAYYGKGANEDILDFIDKRPLNKLELTKTSVTDQFKAFGLAPEQSDCTEADGYISMLIYVAGRLGINIGRIKDYYSPSAQGEIAQIEQAQEEDERRRKAAEEKRREEERKKQEARKEAERRALAKQLKRKKNKEIIGKIVKFAVAAAVILVVIGVISNIIKSFDSPKENSRYDSSEYYVMSDDYTHINVRTGAGTDYDVITVLDSNEVRMYPTGETDGNWIEIDSPDFGIGWVSKKVVKFVQD